MIKRELTDDVLDVLENYFDLSIDEIVDKLKTFKVGEYWEKSFSRITISDPNVQDTKRLFNYVEMLRREGLDIGRGDCEFGYKMPIPEKEKNVRYLQIFRRK